MFYGTVHNIVTQRYLLVETWGYKNRCSCSNLPLSRNLVSHYILTSWILTRNSVMNENNALWRSRQRASQHIPFPICFISLYQKFTKTPRKQLPVFWTYGLLHIPNNRNDVWSSDFQWTDQVIIFTLLMNFPQIHDSKAIYPLVSFKFLPTTMEGKFRS